jgi:hypothetical protein
MCASSVRGLLDNFVEKRHLLFLKRWNLDGIFPRTEQKGVVHLP